MLVIGADLGGTGARAALAQDGHIIAQTSLEGVADRVQAVQAVVRELLARTQQSKVDAVAVGATGYFMRGKELREQVPAMMFKTYGARTVLMCSDMLSAYAGALGLQAGAVIAAGTGAVALGSDLRGTWSRVDGWGYLVGDFGGGSWIGRTALQTALRCADGRPGGSELLLAALKDHFGEPTEMVADLAQREDRAGAMAGFVPFVERAAPDDEIARGILSDAGAHLAETALAALVPGSARVIAMTGNLFRVNAVRSSFADSIGEQAELRKAEGSGVDGALALAAAAIEGAIPLNAPCELFTSPFK